DRFDDALRWSNGRVVIDAELKSLDTVEPAIDVVRRHGAYDWVYFQVGNGLDVYDRVRRYDAKVAVEAAPHNEAQLEALLAKNDPNLLVIALHPYFASDAVLHAVRGAGKLTSLNAWQFAHETQGAGATCAAAFARGIDIAVTNATDGCTQQRDAV